MSRDLFLNMRFYAQKGLLIGFLVLSGGLLPLFFVSAQMPFTDDFESYDLGNLNAQGGWIATYWQVVNDKSYHGSKSIKMPAGNYGYAEKFGDDLTAGSFGFRINLEMSEYQGIGRVKETRFWLKNGEDIICGMKFKDDGSGIFQVVITDGLEEEVINNFLPNTWLYGEIWWDFDTQKCSYVYDYVRYENYEPLLYFNKINGLYISITGLTFPDVPVWVDEIEMGCGLGNCKICEIYDTCIKAGCFWYTTLYPDPFFRGGYCVEPYEPDPEECGSFFKCQYCLTEENCMAELNCEWVDRFGTGEKCFMKEPEFPPEQIPWEVPELEDCDELSGIEKWLCEIKNFIAGIFMPSQAKINSLYQTFGSFSEKFPFNYLQSTKQFFSYVKENLPTGGIPIKILGHQANISFAFWEKTGKVGGVTEKIGDAIRDFTSLILIVGFLTWLLYFVRKFF